MNESTTSATGATSGDPAEAARGPRTSWNEIRDVRRLSRPVHDRRLAGVASGVARHLDIDPLLVRVLFVVLAFFGGAGLFVYGALWLLLPNESGQGAARSLDIRSLTAAVAIVLGLGMLMLLGTPLGTPLGIWGIPWPVIVLAAVALYVVLRGQRDGQQPAAPWVAGPAQTPGTFDSAAAQAASASHTSYAATAPYPTTPYPTADSPTASSAALPAASPAASTTEWATSSTTPLAGQDSTQVGSAVPLPPLRPARQRPADPRKRGPILFWATLALIALAFGVLGMCDIGGLDVLPSTYPATAVAITAVMLLVGAFWGRAGGLIALGLAGLLALVVTTGAERWTTESTRLAPSLASLVQDEESFGAGEIVIDLREVADLEALDGRHLSVNGGVGRVEVILPAGLGTSIESNVGVGSSALLDNGKQNGFGISHSAGTHSGDDVATVTLEISLGVGEVLVQQDVDPDPLAPTSESPAPLTSTPDAPALEGADR